MATRPVNTSHQGQQVFLGNLMLFQHAHIAPVAQNGGPVGNADQFGDPVGHDQHRGARITQGPHLVEQPFSAIEIQRGRAFVQDQDFRFRQQRAGNGDPLLQPQRQGAYKCMGIHRLARQFLHQRGRAGHLAGLRQGFAEQTVRAKIDVVHDRGFVGDHYLLVNGRNAQGAAFGGGGRGFAQDGHRPAVHRQNTRHHLGHRAFAAAVAADNRMNLARAGRKAGAVQRPGWPEILFHIAHRDRITTRFGRCGKGGGRGHEGSDGRGR